MSAGVQLEVVDLTLRYGGAGPSRCRAIVEGVCFAMEPGERVAVVGPSGSGKTTLLHGLAGLLRPESGSVRVDGVLVCSPSGCTRAHAAYMFQRDLLLPWKTILENTTLVARVAAPKPRGRRARAWLGTSLCERAQSLLAEFGLGEYLDALPHELSGGMRQRVALARTLLLGRNLVLLDEPFAGLDALTRADLQDWMRGVMERHLATWILVTHDIHEAVFLADRVAIMGMHPARVVGWVNDAGDRRWAAEEVKQLLAKAR